MAQPDVFVTNVPARLDRLPWSRFHWLVVVALGVTWILDGLEVTLVGSLSPAIAGSDGLNLTATPVGLTGSAYILAAVVGAVNEGAEIAGKSAVQPWMLAIGGLGIGVGLATWGYRVMETIGKKITELTPSRGFAAELAAATTIVVASRLGIPISTTHTLVGAVLGVGLARGIGALDLRVVGKILASWVATLPLAAGLSIFFFYFFKGLLAP